VKGGAKVHRTLPNILFILILFILATAFPLSTDILSLNLSQKIVDKPVEELQVVPELSTVIPTDSDSLLNAFMTFDIKSTSTAFPVAFLDAYAIDVIKNDVVIATKPLSELNYDLLDNTQNTKTVKVSKAEILEGLTAGYYTQTLKADDRVFDYNWYSSNLVYDKTLLKTSNTINKGQTSITLFFPTNDYKNVVPITRHIASPTNRWRTLYTLLANGPKAGLGLYETIPVIPYSPNIRIGNNVANIYLYSKDLANFDGRFDVITEAITRTFMTLGPLDGVSYLVDDSKAASYSGVDLTKTYQLSFTNNAFIGYSHGTTHMMLMPLTLQTATLDERVREAWAIMQFKTGDSELSVDRIQSIPDEVMLIDYTLDGTALTLNVSSNLQSIYNNSTLYNDLLVKSILYTYMSFPEVETVKIMVDGAPFAAEGYDFTQPLKPDPYINMEP
jgi:spore germination protein GerM